jgi:YgiT-type zinc finger domain-containing protein
VSVSKTSCPVCGGLLEEITVVENVSFKGDTVELRYSRFECTECGRKLSNLVSLEKAWRKVWKDFKQRNNYPSPQELVQARKNLGLSSHELGGLLDKSERLIDALENGSRELSDELFRLYTNYVIPGADTTRELVFENLNNNTIDRRLAMRILDKLAD